MPQIVFKGIEKEAVRKISGNVVKELKDIIEVPSDWFTVEYLPVTYFFNGEEVDSDPFIQVNWFDRGLEVQDKVAFALTDIVKSEGYDEVTVVFNNFDKRSYYENKEHFAD